MSDLTDRAIEALRERMSPEIDRWVTQLEIAAELVPGHRDHYLYLAERWGDKAEGGLAEEFDRRRGGLFVYQIDPNRHLDFFDENKAFNLLWGWKYEVGYYLKR